MSGQASNETHDVPWRIMLGWGLGTLPMAIYFNSFNILALRFFVDYVGLTAALAGSLIAASKLYDAVTDPLMGTISDRTNTSMGRRRPYLLLGGLLCGLSIFALFSVPSGLPASNAVLYVTIVIFAYATCYTVYNIPYMAMPAEISGSSKSRSVMMSWRVVFIGAGGLAAGAMGPKIVAWAGGGAEGHSVMGAVLGVAIFLSALVVFFLTSGAKDMGNVKPAEKIPFSEKMKTIATNTPFLMLLAIKFFQLLSVAITAATLAFFTVWVLGKGYDFLGTIILVTTIGQIVGTPIWLRISRIIGKKWCFVVSGLIFCGVSMTWLFASPSEAEWITLARVLVKGLSTGGFLLISQSLLPDTIEYDRLRTGLRREGVLSGMYTTIEKVSFAVGTAVTGLYLDAMGYVGMLRPGSDEQTDSAITAIYYCQSVIPSALLLIAIIIICFFSLKDEDLQKMRQTAATPQET